MSDFSITEAAFSGVKLLGRRPLAAIVWSAIYMGVFTTLVVVFGGSIINFISMVAQHGGKPDPAAVIGLIGSLGGFYLLLVISSIVLNGVIVCAIYRAEIYPDDSRFFYLRFGASEGWLMLMSFVRGILMFIAQMVMSIPIAIITIAAAAAAGHAGAVAGAGLISLALRLVMYAALIWLYLRFSLAGPMTFVDRKFRLFESWTLTQGRVWSLFGVGLLVVLVGVAVYIVMGIVGFSGGFAIWGSVPHPASANDFFSQRPGQMMQFLAPFLEWSVLLLFVGGIVMLPIAVAPWAYVYKRMRPETDIAKVFE